MGKLGTVLLAELLTANTAIIYDVVGRSVCVFSPHAVGAYICNIRIVVSRAMSNVKIAVRYWLAIENMQAHNYYNYIRQ